MKNQGFIVIHVLLIAGLITVYVHYLASAQMASLKNSNLLIEKEDYLNMIDEVNAFLQNPETCFSIFGTQSLNSENTLQRNISDIANLTLPLTTGNPKEIGELEFGKVSIHSLDLAKLTLLSDEDYKVSLSIIPQNSRTGEVISHIKPKPIDLYVRFNDSELPRSILKCNTMSSDVLEDPEVEEESSVSVVSEKSSIYPLDKMYSIKFPVTSEGASVCCENSNEILMFAKWSSYVGNKSTYAKREVGNHCVKLYEGTSPAQSGTVQIFCGKP